MHPEILHIVYSGLGGTVDYVFNLINGDSNQKFKHSVLFYGVEEVPTDQYESAKLICEAVYVIKKAAGIDKEAINKLGTIIKSHPFKAITLHVNSLIYHLPRVTPATTKIIYVEHQSNQLKTRKEWLWSILAQRKANLVVSLTEDYQNELKQKLRFLFNKRKNQVIKTGLQLSDYQPPNSDPEIIKIGMVSRINTLKDHKTLIKAFEELNHDKTELHIAGDGPNLEELKSLSKSDKTKFCGRLSKVEIIEFLQSLTIYVQASKGETSSIAIMQAQCSSLPIIASNVKGINNVLNETNAILVNLEDIQQMKNALEKLILSSELRTELGSASFEFATKNLDNKKMFTQFEKLF